MINSESTLITRFTWGASLSEGGKRRVTRVFLTWIYEGILELLVSGYITL